MLKKGQADFGIITFITVVIGILILAPVLLYTATTIMTEVGTTLNETDENAGGIILDTQTTFTSLFDIVIVMMFLLNVILLLITAFLVDTHPAFMIMYIMFAFFTVIFVPTLSDVVETIYSVSEYQEVIGQNLPFSEFLVQNFVMIIMGILVLSGIVMYAKIKYFSSDKY